MKTELLDYDLPDACIARRPPAERDGGRLLVLERSGVRHALVTDWADLIEPGSLVVVNDTRVRRARVVGVRRGGGGRVEFLLMRRLDAENGIPQKTARFQALGRASRPLRPGTLVEAAPLGSTGMEAQRVCVEVLERKAAGLLEVAVTGEPDVESALEMMGHMPLPPYLGRPDDEQDSLRYQTVFARKLGSVAAPTAGLHLSERLILRLKQRDVRVASLTLQIGMDTFRPIRTAEVDLHPMHTESFEVSAELASEVQAARNRGSRILAVGTTVVRALESARAPTNSGLIQPTRKDTQLFIRAGYRFSVVDGMLTNFHQPKSTLLALVCAFAGRERVLGAYAEAVTRSYRFLSYGDAMWIPDRID